MSNITPETEVHDCVISNYVITSRKREDNSGHAINSLRAQEMFEDMIRESWKDRSINQSIYFQDSHINIANDFRQMHDAETTLAARKPLWLRKPLLE